jgi:hypothetical protein
MTRSVNEKGVDELMGTVAQFAKSQPAAFLGAAALLGFVSSRFAMSTAKPQPLPRDQSLATGSDQWGERRSDGDASYLSTANRSANRSPNGGAAYPGGD